MPFTLSDFEQGVAERIQDTAGKITLAVIDGCIREALAGRYSQVRPLKRVADFAGDGGTYSWMLNSSNFPGWTDNFSVVASVEYPAGERMPVEIDRDEWQLYFSSSSTSDLRLISIVPAAGKTVRVTYTVPHALDGSSVPDADFYGAVNLASMLAAWRLHATYNQLGDSALGADGVDYHAKAAEYRLLAQELEKGFKASFGLDKEEQQPAASGNTEWRIDSESGGRRVMH